MTVTELEAFAYRTFVKIQQEQQNLQAINVEIQKRNAPVEPEVEKNNDK